MWNDKETDIDLLGHEKIAKTILEIIGDSHLRPLTIGVYGDWGVGKSSILSILQKISSENSSKNVHCIVFNGWLFQGYDDSKSALMQTIVSELVKLQPMNKKLTRIGKSLFERINWLKVAKVSSSMLMTGLAGIPDPTLFYGLAGLASKVKGLTDSPEKSVSVNVETESESFLKDQSENSVTGQISSFRKEFKELIEESKVDRLIILVDDLDRCLPKSVIEILEAIRLFLFVEGTCFVISADEKMIEYAVRIHFPNLPTSYNEYTKNYLEKLIQIPIRIPTLNKLQTGNYIKFLLVQNYLNHNYQRVKDIYSHFDSKKKTPYDNIELSYQMITEVLGGKTEELQKTILVADQLSSVLASGLKGNPRNIKRFLNTLFLRLRIAKVYGLDKTINLDVLAKLMVLERFQNVKFEAIVFEVINSDSGHSKLIIEGEKKISSKESAKNSQSESRDDFEIWLELKPLFLNEDLRPYVFISKEKAIGLIENEFSESQNKLLAKLKSGSQTNLNSSEKELEKISQEDVRALFEKLASECRGLNDFKKQPDQMKGLFRIIKVHPNSESFLVEFLSSLPVTDLGPWAISETAGLTRVDAISKMNDLLTSWSTQSDNLILRKLAVQTLKSK